MLGIRRFFSSAKTRTNSRLDRRRIQQFGRYARRSQLRLESLETRDLLALSDSHFGIGLTSGSDSGYSASDDVTNSGSWIIGVVEPFFGATLELLINDQVVATKVVVDPIADLITIPATPDRHYSASVAGGRNAGSGADTDGYSGHDCATLFVYASHDRRGRDRDQLQRGKPRGAFQLPDSIYRYRRQ
jgi:hypothetical protein